MAIKPLIENPFKMIRLLEFEVAFPNEQPKTVEEYLKGGSKELILNAAAHFLGFKNQKSNYEDPKQALEMFFRTENQGLASEVYKNIITINKPVHIFNVYSSLKLFEIFFKVNSEEENQNEAEFEVNLFKALLVLNSSFTKNQFTTFHSTIGLPKELKLPMMLFCGSYPISDKINYNINVLWTSQFIKAMYLFQFLESDPRTQQLLLEFLNRFECTNWKEYLKRLLPLTISVIKNDRETHTDINIKSGEDFLKDCRFLEMLCINLDDEIEESDFLALRSKPFYKIGDGVYRIIFGLFVVEKIFKGIYFQLREINKLLPKQTRISNLKSLFGDVFSEKILSYRIFREIYPNNCIAISGEEFSIRKIDGAPDYYIRKGKDILLVESKDFLIPASVKDSFDFSMYENEFEKKLYFTDHNGIEKPKAVLQLINNIRKLIKSEFIADQNYKYKEITIYPILLTHDHQYDVEGFNFLLNYWFHTELEILATEGFFIHKVKPLVVVNIDFLFHHQVALRNNLNLHEILRMYIEHIHINPVMKFSSDSERDDYLTSKLIPFSVFMDNLFVRRGWKEIPQMFLEFGSELFQ